MDTVAGSCQPPAATIGPCSREDQSVLDEVQLENVVLKIGENPDLI